MEDEVLRVQAGRDDKSFRASLGNMVEWIFSAKGQHRELSKDGMYVGPILAVAEYHLVQKINRTQFVIHTRADLDKTPTLDDPKMEIKYRNGVGYVAGGNSDRDVGQGHERDVFTHECKLSLDR